MSELRFIPQKEITRVLSTDNNPLIRGALFATLCRINALYMITLAGSGHIGSSFSCLDIVAWLYLNELRRHTDEKSSDVFFSSKGHDAPALYAVLIGLGLLPFDKLHTLRRLGGLPGHPDVSISNIAANSGSLGMGISKAKGMIHADRMNRSNRRIFVMTGDGELQEGQIWESLQGAANSKMRELTVIVDHNKIQSDQWVTDTSDLGNIEARFASFGWHVQRCDGHNMAKFASALSSVHDTAKPSVIIADTIKGRGVSFMEPNELGDSELYGFHSGAPSAPDYARASAELIQQVDQHLAKVGVMPLNVERHERNPVLQTRSVERLIPAYGEALVSAGRNNTDLVVLDADLMLDCGLISFRKMFPERYFECGIAEMDMVGQAGGLALAGKLPIVHSFACFLTPRANEQIYNNASEHTKIIYVGSLAGLLPAGPGHSHQSVRDISLMSCVPGMTLFEPSTGAETAAIFTWMVDNATGPCYLRLTSIPVELTYSPKRPSTIHPGRGTCIREGSDAAIFAYGPVMLSEAVGAADILEHGTGISTRVINMPWLNRIDLDWLQTEVTNLQHLFTIDNHYLDGGQGARISAALIELRLPKIPHIKRFGLETLPVCGTNYEALRHHMLDRESLADKIEATINRQQN